MVEVFKTDIKNQYFADILTKHIHIWFSDYEANFDLEDGDSILRVKCEKGAVHSDQLIHMLENFGFKAEILV